MKKKHLYNLEKKNFRVLLKFLNSIFQDMALLKETCIDTSSPSLPSRGEPAADKDIANTVDNNDVTENIFDSPSREGITLNLMSFINSEM